MDAGIASIITVTNTNDSGSGSLREAIIQANTLAGADSIVFNIPGTGPHRIDFLGSLPQGDGAGDDRRDDPARLRWNSTDLAVRASDFDPKLPRHEYHRCNESRPGDCLLLVQQHHHS